MHFLSVFSIVPCFSIVNTSLSSSGGLRTVEVLFALHISTKYLSQIKLHYSFVSINFISASMSIGYMICEKKITILIRQHMFTYLYSYLSLKIYFSVL